MRGFRGIGGECFRGLAHAWGGLACGSRLERKNLRSGGILRPDAFTDTGRSALSESDRFAQDDTERARRLPWLIANGVLRCTRHDGGTKEGNH